MMTKLAERRLAADQFGAWPDLLEEFAKRIPRSARILGGFPRPADGLQVWFGDVSARQFAFDDALNDACRLSDFEFFLRKARTGNGALRKNAFFEADFPVFIGTTAEAVLSAPRDIFVDGEES